jgi:hypothetical protein
MHTIRHDEHAPNPHASWLVTTADGASWHAATEYTAVIRLAEYIARRQQNNGVTA